jgi:hypothetical protein
MAVIDRLKAQFADIGTRHIEVPEWGDESGPLIIYFKAMTLAEKQKLQTIGERDGFVARLADALIMKALDAQGNPIFTIEDKFALRHSVDPDVLARVVVQLMSAPSRDDMAKNSNGTPS